MPPSPQPEALEEPDPLAPIQAMLLQGATTAALAGITPDELEAVYALAYEDIEAGRHEAGLQRALLLVTLDPSDRRFLLAYAHCLHHLGQFESAGRFYGQALLLDATDPVCAFRMGECLVGLGELDQAREAFEAAVKLSWLEPEHTQVRELANRQLDHLTAEGA